MRHAADQNQSWSCQAVQKNCFGKIYLFKIVWEPYFDRLIWEGNNIDLLTDWIGSDAYNLDLSDRRAKAVRVFLEKRGEIDPARLDAVGYGESRPIASNQTRKGRSANRRVEFVIVESK